MNIILLLFYLYFVCILNSPTLPLLADSNIPHTSFSDHQRLCELVEISSLLQHNDKFDLEPGISLIGWNELGGADGLDLSVPVLDKGLCDLAGLRGRSSDTLELHRAMLLHDDLADEDRLPVGALKGESIDVGLHKGLVGLGGFFGDLGLLDLSGHASC